MSRPAPPHTAAERARIALVVLVPTIAAFFLARSVAIEWIAAARRADWSTRPEIENWADPYYGLEWLGSGIGLASAVFVGAVVVAVMVALRPRRGNRP
jgi:hypothetical protein